MTITEQCENEVNDYIEMFNSGIPFSAKAFLPENQQTLEEFKRLLYNLKSALSEYNTFMRNNQPTHPTLR